METALGFHRNPIGDFRTGCLVVCTLACLAASDGDGSVSLTGWRPAHGLAGRGRHAQPATGRPSTGFAYLRLQPTGNETDGSTLGAKSIAR